MLDQREQRAIIIAATCRIDRKDGAWIVPSQTSADKKYMVRLDGQGSCNCPDCSENGHTCKHVRAVRITLKRELGMDGAVTETSQMTLFEEKTTYPRDWTCYNKSQHEEKHRFQILLHELCNGVPEPETKGIGRRPILLCDRLFASIYKIYTTLSSRRFGSDLNDAVSAGHVSRPIHPNKINSFLESDSLTNPLQSLIARTAAPLRALEKDFAVDSTGFSVARHIRWTDEKYGSQRSGRDWCKVHICVGTRTQCVTAAAIYGRDAHDSPIMPELIEATAQTFSIETVTGDKGYLSAKNVETVVHFGGVPFIMPKENSTGGAGGMFERMIHFYNFNRAEFMEKYHRRSLVESAFSAIKRRFGDHLRSRTETAMKNEALAKLVAHNLTRVIASQIELGIDATFWPSQPAGV